ncbi:UNVERIFIED_CONTAM: helix-turn-helix domain-containing protein [Microbacterium sp. SLM126]
MLTHRRGNQAAVFGHRLKRARLERGLSVRDFAERAGVDFRSIYFYEDSSRLPTVDAAMAMAQVLDCSLDWLCGLDAPASAQPMSCKSEIQPMGCEAAA